MVMPHMMDFITKYIFILILFALISVISINTCAFMANALLTLLLYGEY